MINILSRGKKSDLLDSIVKGLCYLLYKYTFQLLQHPLRFDLTFFKKNKRSKQVTSGASRPLTSKRKRPLQSFCS